MAATKRPDSLAVTRRWEPGVGQTLDLSKSAHWDFINGQAARAGMTKSKAPELFKALAAARKSGPGPRQKPASAADALVPLNAIVGLGFGANGTYATAFSAVPGGTIFTNLFLELIDPSTSEVLGTANASQMQGGEYVPIEVSGGMPSGDEVEAIFTVSYAAAGKPPVNVSMRMIVANKADGSPSVQEPVKSTTGTPDLRIALGATRKMPGYDYWYRAFNIQYPNLRLPLVGTQKYGSPIVKSFAPKISAYVIAPTRGGVALASKESLDALQKSLKISGNKITWNMPYSEDPLRDRSIKFGSAAWGEPQVLFVFTIDVLTKKAESPVRAVVCSALSPDAAAAKPSVPSVATIPAIHYIWR